MEVLVENLNEVVDSFKVEEIIIANINTDAEVEASIASVDNLEVAELNKVGVFGISNRHNCETKHILTFQELIILKQTCVNLLNEFLFLLIIKVHVPLGESGLPRSVLNHHKPYHDRTMFLKH